MGICSVLLSLYIYILLSTSNTMRTTKRTTTQQNKRVYNKTNYTTHNLTMYNKTGYAISDLIMYKKIQRAYTTLKSMFGNSYIDMAKIQTINKNGVMCFY